MSTDINHALRQHVTRVGFQLQLGKTHIAALVDLDNDIRWNQTLHDEFNTPDRHQSIEIRRVFRLNVPARHGLIERGLVLRHEVPPGKKRGDMPASQRYEITPAGQLVIDLLKLTGLWQEYGGLLAEPPTRDAEQAA